MTDGPDTPSVEQDLERTWREAHIEPDAVDGAIKILTEARRVLKDGALMKAIKARLDESRDAVAQAGKE